MQSTLPVSRLVAVSVQLTPAGARAQNISTLLILGSSAVIDVVERFRAYEDLATIALDFGTIAPEYYAAALWFGQVPQPTKLLIGRWAQTAANGGLRAAPLSAAQQLLSVWNVVTSGGFTYTKDAGAPTIVTGLNFSSATNLNGVASIIQAALTGVGVVWNLTYRRFEFTSTTTGATSNISFLTAPGTGTDISAMLAARATSSGAYRFSGIAAETAVAAATLFDANYGQSWYALVVTGLTPPVDTDHLAIAGYLEATNTKHLYALTTQESGVLVAADTSNIAYQLQQLAFKRTICQYSSGNPYAVVSAIARQLTVDYRGNSTVITLKFKQEPGVAAETLNASQVAALEGFNCNVLVAYNNDTAIFEQAVTASGVFIDIVTGTDWLALEIQKEVFNLLYTSPTKIPQTDAGTHLLVTTCEAVCSQAVVNGLLAPGTWNASGFGQLKQGDFMSKGFYVYAPQVSSQNPTDRAARLAVPIQIAAKLAGAIHHVDVAVTVNQ